jgi:general stress protein YciG
MKGKQGFASMNPLKRQAIASSGGRAAHKQDTAHKWNSEEARRAGQKGGRAKHKTN